MKQLKTFTGGHPFNLDDLIHIQDGMNEAIISLVKGLLSNGAAIPNCVLYGLEETPAGFGNINYSAGAVIIDGEICQFEAQTINPGLIVMPSHFVIQISDSFSATNPIVYADASLKNVHLIRKAVIVISAVPTAANEIELNTRKSFIDILKTNMSSTEAWRKVGTLGNPASPGWGWYKPTSEIFFRKNIIDNSVDIRGTIVFINTNTLSDPPLNYALITLPVGYIPSFNVPFVVPIKVMGTQYEGNTNNDLIKNVNFFVDTSGNLTVNAEYVPTNVDFEINFYVKFPIA